MPLIPLAPNHRLARILSEVTILQVHLAGVYLPSCIQNTRAGTLWRIKHLVRSKSKSSGPMGGTVRGGSLPVPLAGV